MKNNGFIATSLLYSFFLVFVTLFIGMVSMYIQNKIYLTKFEDSSKNDIYIREMKEEIGPEDAPTSYIRVYVNYENENTSSLIVFNRYSGNTFQVRYSTSTLNMAKCSEIWPSGTAYYAVGCQR